MTFPTCCKWLTLDLQGRPTWLVSFVPHQNRRGRMGNMGTGLNIGLIQSLHDKSSTKIDVKNNLSGILSFSFSTSFPERDQQSFKKTSRKLPFSTCSFGAKAGFQLRCHPGRGRSAEGLKG